MSLEIEFKNKIMNYFEPAEGDYLRNADLEFNLGPFTFCFLDKPRGPSDAWNDCFYFYMIYGENKYLPYEPKTKSIYLNELYDKDDNLLPNPFFKIIMYYDNFRGVEISPFLFDEMMECFFEFDFDQYTGIYFEFSGKLELKGTKIYSSPPTLENDFDFNTRSLFRLNSSPHLTKNPLNVFKAFKYLQRVLRKAYYITNPAWQTEDEESLLELQRIFNPNPGPKPRRERDLKDLTRRGRINDFVDDEVQEPHLYFMLDTTIHVSKHDYFVNYDPAVIAKFLITLISLYHPMCNKNASNVLFLGLVSIFLKELVANYYLPSTVYRENIGIFNAPRVTFSKFERHPIVLTEITVPESYYVVGDIPKPRLNKMRLLVNTFTSHLTPHNVLQSHISPLERPAPRTKANPLVEETGDPFHFLTTESDPIFRFGQGSHHPQFYYQSFFRDVKTRVDMKKKQIYTFSYLFNPYNPIKIRNYAFDLNNFCYVYRGAFTIGARPEPVPQLISVSYDEGIKWVLVVPPSINHLVNMNYKRVKFHRFRGITGELIPDFEFPISTLVTPLIPLPISPNPPLLKPPSPSIPLSMTFPKRKRSTTPPMTENSNDAWKLISLYSNPLFFTHMENDYHLVCLKIIAYSLMNPLNTVLDEIIYTLQPFEDGSLSAQNTFQLFENIPLLLDIEDVMDMILTIPTTELFNVFELRYLDRYPLGSYRTMLYYFNLLLKKYPDKNERNHTLLLCNFSLMFLNISLSCKRSEDTPALMEYLHLIHIAVENYCDACKNDKEFSPTLYKVIKGHKSIFSKFFDFFNDVPKNIHLILEYFNDFLRALPEEYVGEHLFPNCEYFIHSCYFINIFHQHPRMFLGWLKHLCRVDYEGKFYVFINNENYMMILLVIYCVYFNTPGLNICNESLDNPDELTMDVAIRRFFHFRLVGWKSMNKITLPSQTERLAASAHPALVALYRLLNNITLHSSSSSSSSSSSTPPLVGFNSTGVYFYYPEQIRQKYQNIFNKLCEVLRSDRAEIILNKIKNEENDFALLLLGRSP
jgi:hypothetical protein